MVDRNKCRTPSVKDGSSPTESKLSVDLNGVFPLLLSLSLCMEHSPGMNGSTKPEERERESGSRVVPVFLLH